MITKEHLIQYSNIIVLLTVLVAFSCNKTPKVTSTKTIKPKGLMVKKSETNLKPNEGLVYYQKKPFSGTTTLYYTPEKLAETVDYVNGKKHGVFKKWFPNDTLSYVAVYENGKKNGATTTWWKTGKKRSEANFKDGKAQGLQTQWYKSGAKFKEINLVNGKEEGMQKAWRENGKIYNNYEAKNGRIFGLKRAGLCYELEDEIIQYTE